MGYGYGIWLVPLVKTFNTTHIPHITVSCFMNYNDAFFLFDKLKFNFGVFHKFSVTPDPILFSNNTYLNDTNELHSWGYNIEKNNLWDSFKKVCKRYDGCFSEQPHISIEYSKDFSSLNLTYGEYKDLKFRLCFVDITDDIPFNWLILK